jgi:hypothetical protein
MLNNLYADPPPEFIQFSGINYDQWRTSMHLALVYQGYWGIVSGQTICPPEEPASNETRDDYNAWHTENSKACYFILSNMTPLYQRYYKMRNPNAHQLRKQLEAYYCKPPTEIDFYGLRSRLMSITLEECGDVEEYANDYKTSLGSTIAMRRGFRNFAKNTAKVRPPSKMTVTSPTTTTMKRPSLSEVMNMFSPSYVDFLIH